MLGRNSNRNTHVSCLIDDCETTMRSDNLQRHTENKHGINYCSERHKRLNSREQAINMTRTAPEQYCAVAPGLNPCEHSSKRGLHTKDLERKGGKFQRPPPKRFGENPEEVTPAICQHGHENPAISVCNFLAPLEPPEEVFEPPVTQRELSEH